MAKSPKHSISLAASVTRSAEEIIGRMRLIQHIYAGSLARIAPPTPGDAFLATALAEETVDAVKDLYDLLGSASSSEPPPTTET